MFVYMGTRHDMMAHIPAAAIRQVAEVGVLKGENAEWMLSTFSPETLHLVDEWKVFPRGDIAPYYENSAEARKRSEGYFGGPLDDQKTFDKLYQITANRFKGVGNVNIVRAPSTGAAKTFSDGSLDLIYLDANHSYEFVLQDLFVWESKLTDTGYMILNDHTINASGTPEFGVVQAVGTFLRNRLQFVPIAMNLTRYADLIIGKKASDHSALLAGLIGSGKAFELPDSAISNFHLRHSGQFSWMSFA